MRTSMNLAIDSKCNCRSFSVYKYENPSSATFNNCAWIIFSQNTSNLAGYLFIKAFFFNSCVEGTIRGHTFYFVRNCVRWGYYLLFWMNCVADLLWRSFYLRRSSIGKLTSSVPWLVPRLYPLVGLFHREFHRKRFFY